MMALKLTYPVGSRLFPAQAGDQRVQRPGVSSFPTLGAGLLAGLAGGAAEVAWVALYAAASGVSASSVAGGVSSTVLGQSATASPVFLGLVIHFALSVALGIALTGALRLMGSARFTPLYEMTALVIVLGGVWAVNFLLVLPMVNPAFVTLLPYGATLASKLLFGLAAACVFQALRSKPDLIRVAHP